MDWREKLQNRSPLLVRSVRRGLLPDKALECGGGEGILDTQRKASGNRNPPIPLAMTKQGLKRPGEGRDLFDLRSHTLHHGEKPRQGCRDKNRSRDHGGSLLPGWLLSSHLKPFPCSPGHLPKDRTGQLAGPTVCEQ